MIKKMRRVLAATLEAAAEEAQHDEGETEGGSGVLGVAALAVLGLAAYAMGRAFFESQRRVSMDVADLRGKFSALEQRVSESVSEIMRRVDMLDPREKISAQDRS